MFDDSKLLKNGLTLQFIAQAMNKSKAEILFENSQAILDNIPEHPMPINELVYESVAEQFILLGGRSEFLEEVLPLERTQLKNIQRRLEKQGVLNGVIHTKRTLTEVDRTVILFLMKGRIVVTLFLMIYEQLSKRQRNQQVNLYYFLLAYFLTKEIFDHPQIDGLEEPSLPIDQAYFFCRELLLDRAQMFYCNQCGQIYTVFSFESQGIEGIKCPYCTLLSSTRQHELKKQLKTDFE